MLVRVESRGEGIETRLDKEYELLSSRRAELLSSGSRKVLAFYSRVFFTGETMSTVPVPRVNISFNKVCSSCTFHSLYPAAFCNGTLRSVMRRKWNSG